MTLGHTEFLRVPAGSNCGQVERHGPWVAHGKTPLSQKSRKDKDVLAANNILDLNRVYENVRLILSFLSMC